MQSILQRTAKAHDDGDEGKAQRLSASSRRQALNALVFLYREVFQREVGDLSEYRRARARAHLPVWLTREQLERLFACLDLDTQLMACLMYGAGLRLMELLRLRVKDVDLQQEIITVRGGKVDKDRPTPLAHCLVELLGARLPEGRVKAAERQLEVQR